MKKRVLLYAVFGLVFYLLFLIIEMPASWFAWGLNRYTSGTVRLDPITGSLWHGNGKLVIYYPWSVPHDLGSAEWRVNPLWLFTGRIQMHWLTNAPDARLNATLRFGIGRLEILDAEAVLPARTVGAFYSPAVLIAPQGQIRLHTARLAFNRDGLEGTAEILWQEAGSALSGVQPLGDYRLDFNAAGKTANLKLTTARGALDLSGQGQWQLQNGSVQFTGAVTPRERAGELEPLLKLFGEDQGGGKRSLMFNGNIPIAVTPNPPPRAK